MALVIQVGAVCLVGALLAVLLKKEEPEFALLLTVAAAAVVVWWLRGIWEDLTGLLRQLAGEAGLMPELFVPLIKTVGIALVSRICAGICRDASQEALAVLVEATAAFCAIGVSLPLLQAVWQLLQELL